MGQKLASYDANGDIIAYYDTVDSPAPASATTIEITDAQWMTCLSTPGYTVVSGELVAPIPPTQAVQLATLQVSLCAQIDGAADQVYIAIGGPSPGRLAEYQQANADAQAFKAAGYTGTVPATIACWVTASGMTTQAATDNIIATAAAWISVLENIREARLIGKKNVNTATNTADAQAAANNAITQIQATQAQA
jgi:hypothetical protein